MRSVYSSMDSCCGPIAWASSKQIVFIDDYQLKRVDLRSGSVAALDTGAPSFMLSPNRQTIAIDQGCECGHAPDAVGLVDVDGRGTRLIPKPKTATDELDGFSPDGTELVFSRYRFVYDNTPMNKPSLFAVSVKGGAPVPLSKSGLIGAADLPVGADNVSWSPDGRWLSYFTSKGLWLTSTSTGKPRLAVSSHGWGRPLSRDRLVAHIDRTRLPRHLHLRQANEIRATTVDHATRRRHHRRHSDAAVARPADLRQRQQPGAAAVGAGRKVARLLGTTQRSIRLAQRLRRRSRRARATPDRMTPRWRRRPTFLQPADVSR